MSVFEYKHTIRSLVKDRIREYSPSDLKERSAIILTHLQQVKEFKQADTVLVYWSLTNEVYTHGFIEQWRAEKVMLLPVIKGGDICIKKFQGRNNMRQEPGFGIWEPTGEEYTGKIDFAIVPGMAFDIKYNRLGRGKGYYDRLLTDTNAFKVGVCFNFQLFDDIPHDSNDIKMDLVITETGIVNTVSDL